MINTLFKAIVGSRSYGTNIATSDTDYKGVYIQNLDDLLSFDYKEQIEIGKDETYYEIKRFLQLLQSANPTVLELLYSPQDCILSTSEEFNLLVKNRHLFLTKKCLHSFGGYAIAQINKARGLEKKMNWEGDKIVRKDPLDFAYIYEESNLSPLKDWLRVKSIDQKKCSLSKVDNLRDGYRLYYQKDLGRGLIDEDSNEIRVSTVPVDLEPLALLIYNKDAYSVHCKKFKEYENWLNNRNVDRYVDIQNHQQKIDGKNMLHCRRLLDMAMEIAKFGELIVRRPNAPYLLSIRRGDIPLQDIISKAEEDIKSLDELFEKSHIPEACDMQVVKELLLTIRKKQIWQSMYVSQGITTMETILPK